MIRLKCGEGKNYSNFVKSYPNYLPDPISLNFFDFHGFTEKYEKEKKGVNLIHSQSITKLYVGAFEDIEKRHAWQYNVSMLAKGKYEEVMRLVSGLTVLRYVAEYSTGHENDKIQNMMRTSVLNDNFLDDLIKSDAWYKDKITGLLYTLLHDHALASCFVKKSESYKYTTNVLSFLYKCRSHDKCYNINDNSLAYALNNHSLSCLINDKCEEALKQSSKSFNFVNNNSFAHYVRALILDRLGEKNNALEEFELSKKPQLGLINCIKALVLSEVVDIPKYLRNHEAVKENALINALNIGEFDPKLYYFLLRNKVINISETFEFIDWDWFSLKGHYLIKVKEDAEEKTWISNK